MSYMDMFSLKGKVALVTGGSYGIGFAIARAYARAGARIAFNCRSQEHLDMAMTAYEKEGIEAQGYICDVTDTEKVRDMVADIDASLGTIDILVNNAGIAGDGSITALDPTHVTAMINLNVLAVTRLAAAIAPRLAASGEGTIINITSVTALMPDAFSAVYPATKAFVLAFTEALHAQLSPAGVRVQGVLPGITRTAIWEEEKLETIPAAMVMDVNEMVDAALSGLDLGEVLTVPSLPENTDLDTFLAARSALRPNLSRAHAAARYGLA